MKIELTKETSVVPSANRGVIGDPDIWFWVTAWETKDMWVVRQCFRDEGEAKQFHAGLVEHHNTWSTYKPVSETILSTEL